ncbi:MAG: SusF/SusE family outer membrane protein [Muribaculaceae bacterium]|nr:SusF/SusE family outer membrane protein [Muribaculaceae bacterium]
MKKFCLLFSLLLMVFININTSAADALFLTGEHSGWSTDVPDYAFKLDQTKGVFYLDISLVSDTEVKLTTGHAWDENYGGTYQEKKLIPLYSNGTNIKIPAGSWRILVKQDCSQMLVVPQGQLYVVGEYPGTTWDFSTAVKGTYANNIVTWDMGENAPARDFSVKFIYVNDGTDPGWSDLNNIGGGDLEVNSSISGVHGGGNIIPKNGTKTLTYDWTRNSISSIGEAPTPEPATLYVVGTNCNWISDNAPAMTLGEDGIYTYDFGHCDSDVEFKILTQKAWVRPYYGVDSNEPLAVGAERNMVEGDEGLNFKISQPGTYTIHVDLENLKLVLSGRADPVAGDYNITVNESEHGRVTANKAKGQEGDTVKLTITPETGFELNTLEVKAGEQVVEVDEDNSFVMPAADVVVSATFKELPLYVIGNIESLGEWVPNGAKIMIEDSHGVWHCSLGHVIAGTQFKFIIGNSNNVWDDHLFYGPENAVTLGVGEPANMVQGGSGNFIIGKTGTFNLTVNSSRDQVTLTGTVERPDLSIRTNADDWTMAEPLVLADDNSQSITKQMTAGTEFKFTDQNNVWYGAATDNAITKEVVQGSTPINLVAGDGGKNFVMPVDAEWKFTIDPECNTMTITGEWPEETTPELFVLGDVEGSSWTLEADHIKIPYDSEKKIFTGHINISAKKLGYFAFATKIVNDWVEINPYRIGGTANAQEGVNCDITSENQDNVALATGTSDFSFIPATFCISVNEDGYDIEVDLENMTMKVIGDIPPRETPGPQPVTDIKLARWGFNDYQELDFTLNEETGKYVLEDLAMDFTHTGFKIVMNGESTTWLGGEGVYLEGNLEITPDKLGQTLQLESPGQDILIPAGTYTFTFDAEALTLVVTGEANPPALYLVGSSEELAFWNASDAPQMNRNGNTYTYKVAVEGTLKFKVLMQQSWDGIDFGTANNAAVTVGHQYDLAKGGYNFLIDQPGTYVVSVDGIKRQLTVNKFYLKGDVNDDGEVGIADITALISLILEGNSNERSDVNEDGETSIADLTALISIVLNQE